MVEDLRQDIEHYASGPVVFIGHSWGAMYATVFINTYGSYDGRIRGAVLSEPGGLTKAQLDGYMERMNGSIDLLSEMVNDVTWGAQFLTPADHARADYAQMRMTRECQPAIHCDPDNPSPAFRQGAVAAAALWKLADEDGFDWTQHLKSFTPTVLFLRGELNEAAPLSYEQELASSFARAEIVTIPGVGHEMIWERPAEYLEQVRAYFEQIGFAGGAP